MVPYSAFMRTRKAVKFEISTIFEKEYLPNMPWYFNDLGTM